jgi:hypothetical protein
MVGSIKSYLYIALAFGFIYLAGEGFQFVDEAMDNAATIVRQEAQLEIRDARISNLESEKAQIQNALIIAEEERQALVLRNSELRDIRDKALTAGEEADGEISPVLGDTLRALSE